MNGLSEFLAALPISPAADHIHHLQNILHTKTFSKGECALHSGDVCTTIYFIKTGLLRHYLLDDGEEINTHFALPGTFTTDFASLSTGKPANVSIEALEKSQVLMLDRKHMLDLYEKIPSLQGIGRKLMELLLAQQQERLEVVLRSSAIERYNYLVEKYPAFVQAVPLKHIASYLGVSRETLSRIRGKRK